MCDVVFLANAVALMNKVRKLIPDNQLVLICRCGVSLAMMN
jgi:hypothetical protein